MPFVSGKKVREREKTMEIEVHRNETLSFQLSELHCELAIARRDASAMQLKLQSLQDEFEKSNATWEEQRRKMQGELETAMSSQKSENERRQQVEDKLSECSRSLAEAEEHATELQELLHRSEESTTRLDERVKDLESMMRDAKEETQRLRQQVLALTQQLDSANKTNSQLKSQLQASQSAENSLMAQQAALRDEAEKRATTAEEQRAAHSAETLDGEGRRSALLGELEALARRRRSRSDSIEEARARIVDLEGQISRLNEGPDDEGKDVALSAAQQSLADATDALAQAESEEQQDNHHQKTVSSALQELASQLTDLRVRTAVAEAVALAYNWQRDKLANFKGSEDCADRRCARPAAGSRDAQLQNRLDNLQSKHDALVAENSRLLEAMQRQSLQLLEATEAQSPKDEDKDNKCKKQPRLYWNKLVSATKDALSTKDGGEMVKTDSFRRNSIEPSATPTNSDPASEPSPDRKGDNKTMLDLKSKTSKTLQWLKKSALPSERVTINGRGLKVIQKLGEGEASVVHLCKDDHGNQLALRREFVHTVQRLAALQRGASIMRGLQHGKIIRLEDWEVVDKGQHKEVLMLMEYGEKSLAEHLAESKEKKRFLSDPEHCSKALRIFSDVVDAVVFLHSQHPPIAHRDVRSNNVLMVGHTAKLYMFAASTHNAHQPSSIGEARAAREEIERHTVWNCRAPEMCEVRCGVRVDEKVDVWTLGCLLFELCYMQQPFLNEAAIASGELPPFPAVPRLPELVTSLLKMCLVPDPSMRPDVWGVAEQVCALRGVSPPHRPAVVNQPVAAADLTPLQQQRPAAPTVPAKHKSVFSRFSGSSQ